MRRIRFVVSVQVHAVIVTKRFNLDASLDPLLQILSLTLFEKMPLRKAFQGSDYTSEPADDCSQLNRFAF